MLHTLRNSSKYLQFLHDEENYFELRPDCAVCAAESQEFFDFDETDRKLCFW